MKKKPPLRILIMGLPGAGKTTLAEAVASVLTAAGHTVRRLNADEVRKEHNDWDFSAAGRIRQAERMRKRADSSDARYVVCDFVAPLPEMRDIFGAHITVWVDTIQKSEYEDTNAMFIPPTAYDLRVTSQDAPTWASEVVALLQGQ